MKQIIALAAVAALAACSQSEPAPEPTATAEPAAETPATTAADGLPSWGKFGVTKPDGTHIVVDVNEDGTYAAMSDDGKVLETGKWEQKSPESYCETPDTDGAEQVCYSEQVVDGVYTSTDPVSGEVSTVVRM